MPSSRNRKARSPHPKEQIKASRVLVRRWLAWFLPPTVLLTLVCLLRADMSVIAICMLAFPIITIRVVECWNDYRTALEESSKLA